jgi:ribosomal protein S27E
MPSRSQDRDQVRCGSCGNEEIVSGPVCAPTDGIVWDVCRRDPCPACGEMELKPTHPELLADPSLTNAISEARDVS